MATRSFARPVSDFRMTVSSLSAISIPVSLAAHVLALFWRRGRRRGSTSRMLKSAVIDVGGPLWASAEWFVRASFVSRYRARLTVFRPYPWAIADARDEIRRTAEFSFQADASEAEAFAIASPVFPCWGDGEGLRSRRAC